MSFLHEPGDLASTPLAAILLEALNLRATGVLAVAHGGGTSRLWIREGRPVGAQVVTGFRPLGHMLLHAGLIDIDALSRSLGRMAETGRPQGEILVELGAVSRADVDRVLAEQQAGYFALIAALEQGALRFDATLPMPEWTRGGLLSPLRTIVDALERPQAGALVLSALQPVSAGGLRLASGYAEVEPAFRWTQAERALVSRLLRVTTLEAFLARSDVPAERARAMVAGLLLLGLAVPAAERPAPSGETFSGLAIDIELLEPVPEIVVAPALTPAPAATPGQRSDPAEARARRQRLLQQAMRNMGVGPFGGPRASGAPTPPRPTASPASSPAAVPPTSGPSAEEALRKALLDIAPRAREKDYFARLGLTETATRDDVKKAFLALARQFHPDRFAAPALRDLGEQVKELFTAVNEAYEVLADDRKRSVYLADRAQGVSKAHADSARVDFQKGEACLRTRDWPRARGFYESAVRADPRPEYQAALAFACLTDPQRRDRERARSLLAEATRDAACDRAAYAAGILARDEGDEAQAERWFRAAAAANPRHADATRELRALEGRRAERRGR
jgi:curved DNA-binding protein CbpA